MKFWKHFINFVFRMGLTPFFSHSSSSQCWTSTFYQLIWIYSVHTDDGYLILLSIGRRLLIEVQLFLFSFAKAPFEPSFSMQNYVIDDSVTERLEVAFSKWFYSCRYFAKNDHVSNFTLTEYIRYWKAMNEGLIVGVICNWKKPNISHTRNTI